MARMNDGARDAADAAARALDILVVAPRYPLASETFVRAHAAALARLGHRVEVLALAEGDGTYTEVERAEGLPARTRVAAIDAPRWRRLAALPVRMARTAARDPRLAARLASPAFGWRATSGQLAAIAAALGAPRRFDAIDCQFGPAGRVMQIARRAGIVDGMLTVAFYGHDVTRELATGDASIYRGVFDAAALLLPNSDFLGTRLRAAGAPAARVETLRLGIDLRGFAPVDRSARPSPPRALAVGRFVEKKGFAHLLRALAIAGDRAPFTLRLVGDGPLRGELEALAATLGLGARVSFAGWRSSAEVAREMTEADLLVVPSVTAADGDMEGLPIVIVEAMATGLPVVGTLHSGIPEIVEDGVTGRLVAERDDRALAEALVEMADPGPRLAAARAARARIEAGFDVMHLAARYAELVAGRLP
jgi:colanic acid/amylovoran biosynthesis glycosyltransferase